MSPIPAVMADASKNHIGFHCDDVDRLIKKLLVPSNAYATEEDCNQAVGDLKNIFWTEFEHFQSKNGPFANKEHIWNSPNIDGKVCAHGLHCLYYNTDI